MCTQQLHESQTLRLLKINGQCIIIILPSLHVHCVFSWSQVAIIILSDVTGTPVDITVVLSLVSVTVAVSADEAVQLVSESE